MQEIVINRVVAATRKFMHVAKINTSSQSDY
jgi:hypothetical protein